MGEHPARVSREQRSPCAARSVIGIWSSHRSDSCRIENRPRQGVASRSDSRDLQFGIYSGFRRKRPRKINYALARELHDRCFAQLSTVPTAIRVVPIVSAEPTLSRLRCSCQFAALGAVVQKDFVSVLIQNSPPRAQYTCVVPRLAPTQETAALYFTT
jgi:hypothetical protein